MSEVYSVAVIEDKVVWENFISSRPEANFLQSWNFGEFHQALSKKVYRLGLWQAEQLIGVALCVQEEAKRGRYLAIAGGPIIDWTNQHQTQTLFDYIRQLGKKQGCHFVRIRPQVVESETLKNDLHKLGFVESPMHLTADLTLQLDLNLSEDELLQQMRKNTRYEVRRVDKENIRVVQSVNPDDIKPFHQQQLAVAQKHHFIPFSYDFLYQQFLAMRTDDNVVLFHSYQGEQLLASAFIIFYNKEAVYHYGVSTAENQRLPGSYACQWEAIKEAKRRGCTRYNFWGIAPEGKPNHRFAGVSIFKRGFGGQEVQYLPAHDLPLSAWYKVTQIFELTRKYLRKL